MTIGIIGYGRFGSLLGQILKPFGRILAYDIKYRIDNKTFFPLTKVARADWIFLAVPISAVKEVLSQLKLEVRPGAIVMDVCSVKTWPCRWMKQILPQSVEIIGTHPFFGPDSYHLGLENLQLIVCPVRVSKRSLVKVLQVFKKLKLNIITTTPKEHDRQSATSLALVHFLGRTMAKSKVKRQRITTLGFEDLLKIYQTTNNDTWQLFYDMHNYNPYASKVRENFLQQASALNQDLINKKYIEPVLKIGICGGKGSFTEEAAKDYCQRKNLQNYQFIYLYNATPSMVALKQGEIDLSVIPLENNLVGAVEEAEGFRKGERGIEKVAVFTYPIQHHLLALSQIEKERIKMVASHPQALEQCQNYLRQNFPQVKIKNWADTALAAEDLQSGKLPKTTAVITPKSCSRIYQLKIIASEIQDFDNNKTIFGVFRLDKNSKQFFALREQIQGYDNLLIKILSARMKLIKPIKALKKKLKLPVADKKREAQLLTTYRGLAKNLGLDLILLNKIFKEIFSRSKKIQKK